MNDLILAGCVLGIAILVTSWGLWPVWRMRRSQVRRLQAALAEAREQVDISSGTVVYEKIRQLEHQNQQLRGERSILAIKNATLRDEVVVLERAQTARINRI